MAKLVIISKMSQLMKRVPHKILINGHFAGVMQTPQVVAELPAGTYTFTIQSMFPYFSSTVDVNVCDEVETCLEFADREMVWDILFVIDIILWLIKGLLHLTTPWTWIYEIFTNGYFVLWLIYEWRIRKKYFRVKVYAKVLDRPLFVSNA